MSDSDENVVKSSPSLSNKLGNRSRTDPSPSNNRRSLGGRSHSDPLPSDRAGPSRAVERKKRPLEEDEDTRPWCRYGEACYRVNPQHKTEFRHPDPDSSSKPSTSTPSPTLQPIKRPRHTYNQSPAYTSPAEVYAHAQPFSFYLTRVEGIADKYNGKLCMHISDILSPSMGTLKESAQFNYMIQIPWLLGQYPREFRDKPLLVVHGEQKQSKVLLERDAKSYPNVTLCQAKLEIMYGTHHSKMMFLLYETGLRVVIHTANLYETDWKQKSQGVWLSPVFPISDKPSEETDSPSNFKRDLLHYLKAYKSPMLGKWIHHIKSHDMSSAKVHLIASVPGRHQGEAKNSWGHLKLRKVLQQHGPLTSEVRPWPVVGQFSSIGSLGAKPEQWLTGELLNSLAAGQGGIGRGNETLKLIFPSKENIRTSLEGYPAGASVPYSINVAKKQLYAHSYFHLWQSECRGRSRASPHIKTYCRLSPNAEEMAWFLVTSANLSKAAWGAQEKNGFQLMIRSYEIGVLFLPQAFKCSRLQVMKSVSDYQTDGAVFPVPYDLPPQPYAAKDRPWIWDIPYTDLPDTNGNDWCPP